MSSQGDQVCWFDRDTWCGKTSLEHSAATAGETSRRCLKKRSASRSRKPPVFRCLNGDGLHTEGSATWEEDGLWLGASSMRNTGECPSDGVESRLSRILEETPPTKYFLSAQACQGILNRAQRRGKDLPEPLKAALLMQSESGGDVTAEGKAH